MSSHVFSDTFLPGYGTSYILHLPKMKGKWIDRESRTGTCNGEEIMG